MSCRAVRVFPQFEMRRNTKLQYEDNYSIDKVAANFNVYWVIYVQRCKCKQTLIYYS